MKVDWLIVGAGFSGSVLAERIASQLNQRVLVVEQRDHVGGNAFDHYDSKGLLVHRYGPHIFHTNDNRVWSYLSQFTSWRVYYHHVLGVIDGSMVPVPFNLNSLHRLFPRRLAGKLESRLLAEYGFNLRVPILNLREASDPDLRWLAGFIYKKVFEGYTIKQWGLRPEELGRGVTGRVPVSISRDDRYFDDVYQAMPANGFTELFRRMLSHKNIKLLLNTDYREVVKEVHFGKMVYTGPLDTYFEYAYGRLPYRSLRFEREYHEQEKVQDVGTVNYPNEQPFTRITEFKHLTGQRHHGTSVVREFAQPFVAGENEPYYPFPTTANQELADRYTAEVAKLKGTVLFAGRLAEYKYYNMDQAVARALMMFEKYVVPGSG